MFDSIANSWEKLNSWFLLKQQISRSLRTSCDLYSEKGRYFEREIIKILSKHDYNILLMYVCIDSSGFEVYVFRFRDLKYSISPLRPVRETDVLMYGVLYYRALVWRRRTSTQGY